ncbi:MAG: rhomboid family intramembrane serine protease [Prevotellaceae bacterium]|jgi:membrane associated rhomboid family serine protease|nr:rhomboid family intramembrane serine protease [Prevotellaceae bacterium]
MINPHTLIAIVTVGVSILAFQNRELFNKCLMYPYGITRKNDQWYRLITHAFIHADWMHLLFNMIALWSFGNAVFNYFAITTSSPSMYFFIMYFLAILFSSIPDLTKHKNDMYYSSLGASGAVSAVIFFNILLDPWSMILIFFIPCPGIIFGVVYLIYSNYMGKRGGGNISHDAHFYGAVFGLLYPLFVEPSIYMNFIHRLLNPSW